VNSPRAAYQVEPTTLALLRRYGTSAWDDALAEYAESRVTLVEQYAKARQLHRVPVQISSDQVIDLGPGAHSQLIRAVIEEFAPRFAPGSVLVYVGDTDSKWSYCDKELMAELGIAVDPHGKMPDVVLYFRDRDWLLLVEAVTSHGPVDGKRFQELSTLFAGSTAGLVFVTAFPDRSTFSRYQAEIAWETEVWVADAPSHMVHFNGDRFLGPYG
jgi:hypothetical protein